MPDAQVIHMPRRNYKSTLKKFDDGSPSGYAVPHAVSVVTWTKMAYHIERAFLVSTGWRAPLRESTKLIGREMLVGGVSFTDTCDIIRRSIVEHPACMRHDRVAPVTGMLRSVFLIHLMTGWICSGRR